ncbi:hypothetical protein A3I53_04110 [Candidatus Curtissbacteria bacterium RIFCSPLOWO2_02_FULL_40_13b]|uniref:DNA repair protein RadA n=1 Tax=Candidatus Curtissbacteria bacterium RIFCSPLOWO2_02_FULL_40_13b TaxID=1797733 RepID=A0A1F5HQH9_9BACT|nr:MAG: hypothetical protein A3I53_04110 [Candidatus Curtissbacteria bacterium RIFCSPLOWO2_02_FULL_40_13b]
MKQHSEFVCQQCGFKSPSFYGKCPECGSWNSLVETSVSVKSSQSIVHSSQFEQVLIKLSDVKKEHLKRTSTGFGEFDRVLGGGIVPGSIVLIAGDPGIGKSTLLLQVAMQLAGSQSTVHSSQKDKKKKSVNHEPITDNQHAVLYVTGEESPQQVKIRADRIETSSAAKASKDKQNSELKTQNLFILPQTDVEAIVAASEKIQPVLLIVDSIQTITTEALSGSAGSVGQVRECAQILQRYAKSSGVPIFVVGHVTKEGNIAGPKVLEHLVDAVLNLEGDGTHAFRILRSTKNRFGSTFEVGVFEMQDAGLIEVANPSSIFLSQRLEMRPGSVVCASIAGVRPVLCEIQALTTSTIFGIPTRRVTGLDFARVQIVLAALVKAANLPLGSLDVYVNVAGGLKINEPAADLPAALAVVSAAVGKPTRSGLCAFGEVGLLGELRPVSNFKSRVNEAKRLGFSDFVTADRFKTLEEAIGYAIHGE